MASIQNLIIFLRSTHFDNEMSVFQVIKLREKRGRVRAVGFEILQYLIEKTTFPQVHSYILRIFPSTSDFSSNNNSSAMVQSKLYFIDVFHIIYIFSLLYSPPYQTFSTWTDWKDAQAV